MQRGLGYLTRNLSIPHLMALGFVSESRGQSPAENQGIRQYKREEVRLTKRESLIASPWASQIHTMEKIGDWVIHGSNFARTVDFWTEKRERKFIMAIQSLIKMKKSKLDCTWLP